MEKRRRVTVDGIRVKAKGSRPEKGESCRRPKLSLMARARKDLGERGELAALKFLAGLGYLLVEKNHRRRWGEIDLVLRDGEVLVFCEVKTSQLGFAWESYSLKQRKRMSALVVSYLARSGWEGPVRVDLLALDREPDSPHYRIEHFQDVLSVDEGWF